MTNLWWIVPGAWVFIALCGFLPVMALRFASFQPRSDRGHADSVTGDAMRDAGFSFEAVIRPLGMTLTLWRHADGVLLAATYRADPGGTIDLVSEWHGGVELTTASTGEGAMLPSGAGSLKQCLIESDLPELLAAHRAAAEQVSQALHAPPVDPGPAPEAVRRGVFAEQNLLLRRPWLILTLPYRYAVTRFRYRGVRLSVQVERGWVDLREVSDAHPASAALDGRATRGGATDRLENPPRPTDGER